MRKLEGLEWRQRFVEHLGCIKGCLEYLGGEMSFSWLYGGTGHAFIINMNETLDVESPYAWNAQMLFALAPNLGYEVDGFSIWKDAAGAEFPQKQREAWDFVRGCIARGLPCYGWELKAPYGGYWVINGYNDVGYYYSGWESGGPLPWQKLGDLFVTLLEVHSVQLCEPASDSKIVKDALTMALKHAENPKEWIEPQCHSGPAGFDLWAEALEAGRAQRDGQWYNTEVWHECREMAVEFLNEAKQRLPGRCDAAFDEAAGHYTVVRDKMRALLELHPEREKPDWESMFASPEGAALVCEAGAAERKGLECLKRIADLL